MATLGGNVYLNGGSKNYLPSGNICGTGFFYASSSNENSLACAYFFQSSYNAGIVMTAAFQDFACNKSGGEVIGCGCFLGNSYNAGIVMTAAFQDFACNKSQVRGCACFLGNSKNEGTVCTALFSGNAVNSGVIRDSGLFLGTSENKGTISGNAFFATTSINNGSVSGSTCCSYIQNGKDWIQTSSYISMIGLTPTTSPNLFAINSNGEKAIVKTNNSVFKTYSLMNSLSQNPTDSYRPWQQIGFYNVGGDIVSIVDSGNTLAMNGIGNRIAIGNFSDEVSGISNHGSATVYDYDSCEDMWSAFPYYHKFISSPNICFGASVSLNFSGDRVAIGAPGAFNYMNSTSGNGAISIHCWHQDNDNPNFNRWYLMSDKLIFGQQGEGVGKSVKLNQAGDKIVFSTLSGFKVYEAIDDWDWQQMGSTIYLPNANQHQLLQPNNFSQVSINGQGDKILVSQTRLMQDLISASGVVAAYCWNGLSWNQIGSVLHSEYPNDYFGLDIDMNLFGDKIIVGANNSLAGTPDSGRGRALIYDWNGSDWVENNYALGKPDIDKPPYTYYGQQVSIVGSGNVAYATNQVSGITFVSRYEIL